MAIKTQFHTRSIFITSIAALTIVVGSLIYFNVHANASAEKNPASTPAAPVDVAQIVNREIIDWQSYSGRLEAIDRVEIRPLVSGTLMSVHFKDGNLVKKGDLLFTIDQRPYAAEVARAQAQVTAADARIAYTSSDLARAQRLIADNAIARRDFEEKQNAAREAEANLQIARAALRTAQLNLEYTRITAPVSGRISRAEVTPGNIVSVGSGTVPLTTLVSVSKIYATFDVDEQSFLKYINPHRSSNVSEVPVFLGLANEDGYSRQGKVNSIDNRIDTTSGTIRVRAEFDNKDGLLVPGLYARVRLGGNEKREALLIDEKAIGTDQDKRFVLVVDGEHKTAYREIRLGANYEGLRVVESGLKPGEKIVVNGLQRVKPGDKVTPQIVAMIKQDKATASADSSPPASSKTSTSNTNKS
jgi:multidrug efflux system membrane fusion protein